MKTDNDTGKALWAIAIGAALVAGLPFVNKPLHIDDTVVLRVAERICQAPLDPYSAKFNWFNDPQVIFETTTNPPFVSYYLAPVFALFGASEIALHLAMLPFLLLFTWAMVILSRRFARGSVWPILFAVLSPAVIVSTNIMRDVPYVALATASVALFVVGTDRERWIAALGGGVLAGLAMVTKYSAVILLPVLAVYPLLQRKPRFLLGMVPAAAILGLWYLQNYMVHGQIHFLYLMEKGGGTSIPWIEKLTAAFVITGASFFLIPALLAQAIRRRSWIVLLGATAAVAATFLLLRKIYPWDKFVQYNSWALLGAAVVYWVFVSALFAGERWWRPPFDDRSFDSLFLLWWMIGPYLCGVFFVGFSAVRHILPAAAPVALLAVRYTQRPDAKSSRWVAGAFAIGLLVQIVFAYWTGLGDYQFADCYRQFAREAKEKYKPPAGNQVWYEGHWGWQHYCEKAGFRQVTQHGEAPKAGDIVLFPMTIHKGARPQGLGERCERIDRKVYPARLHVTTMDWGRGFYNTSQGIPPARFGKRDGRRQYYEIFDVLRVKPKPE